MNDRVLRHLFPHLALLASSLVCSLLLLEALCRGISLWEQWNRKNLHTIDKYTLPDTTLGYRLKPDYAGRLASPGEYDVEERYNRLGIRSDREYGNKPEGVERILSIGDSFTYGPGVQWRATYPLLLEAILNRDGDSPRYEVINAGVPGYDTVQEFEWLKRLAPVIQPDVVILGYYMGNDPAQNALKAPAGKSAIDSSQQRFYANTQKPATPAFPLKRLLAEHSHAYGFIRDRYHKLRALMRSENRPSDRDAFWLFHYRKDFLLDDEATFGFGYNLDLLREMADWTAKRRIRLYVLFIPERSQLSLEYWQKTVQDIVFLRPEDYDLEKPNRWLMAFCEREGIPALDLLPLFRQTQDSDKTFYYPQDGHWSPQGHQAAAEFLGEWIREEERNKRSQNAD